MTMMRQLVPAALRLRSRSLSLGIALIAVATSWAVFAQETPVSDLAPQVETPPPPPVVVKPVISRDKGANAFLDVYRVLLHPRCMNCHPNGDVPLQTDASIPHTMNIVRDSANVGLPCSTCHRETMPTEANLPPGLPTWHMPPKEVPMVFEGKTPAQLCTQLKTPKETAGRDLDALVEHVEKDALVRHEDVVEHDDRRRLAIFLRELRRRLAGTPGRAGDDGDTRRIHRHRAGHGKGCILRRMRAAGHDQEVVHVGRAGHDRLGAANDDSVGPPLLHVNVNVGVGLRAGPF